MHCPSAVLGKFQDDRELSLSKSKYATKLFLQSNGVSVPALYRFASKKSDINESFFKDLPDTFVIKPNYGSCGEHIHTLETLRELEYMEPDGTVFGYQTLRDEVLNYLIDDTYQNREYRVGVLVEQRIMPHPDFKLFSDFNTISDFRILYAGEKIVLAWVRVPTAASRGYGARVNGALALAIDHDGRITTLPDWNFPPPVRTDTGKNLLGIKVPQWDVICRETLKVKKLFKSKVLAVDGCVNADGALVVPEVTFQPDMIGFKGWSWLLELAENA